MVAGPKSENWSSNTCQPAKKCRLPQWLTARSIPQRNDTGERDGERATQGLLPSRSAFLPTSEGHGTDPKSTVWISRQWLYSFLGIFRKEKDGLAEGYNSSEKAVDFRNSQPKIWYGSDPSFARLPTNTLIYLTYSYGPLSSCTSTPPSLAMFNLTAFFSIST